MIIPIEGVLHFVATSAGGALMPAVRPIYDVLTQVGIERSRGKMTCSQCHEPKVTASATKGSPNAGAAVPSARCRPLDRASPVYGWSHSSLRSSDMSSSGCSPSTPRCS